MVSYSVIPCQGWYWHTSHKQQQMLSNFREGERVLPVNTMLGTEELPRNSRHQQPSNQTDIDSSVI
jgi:hypothetical protein